MSYPTGTSDLLVSVVSPIRDAETWVEGYLRDLSALLAAEFDDFEIVLVDNASTDGTVSLIESLQPEIRNVQLYCLARSIPYESAFVVALEQAIGDVVITLDAAYDPINPLVEMIRMSRSGAEIVYGLRTDRTSGRLSLYNRLSKLFFTLFRKLTGEDLPVAASTLRLYTRRVINAFLDNNDRYSLFPVIAAFSGLLYQTFHYERINRTGIPLALNYQLALAKAFRLVFLSSHYPLRLLSLLAMFGAFLNVLYSIWVVLVNVFKQNVAEGWTTLSMQNSAMFFILFVILAILSEYITRLMINNQNRPFYLIAKESRSLVLRRKQRINVIRNENHPDTKL
ncbi:glycosyltransferase [Leptolyngbya sp. FACHB-36]|uniref:glycosyltransferase n=1 Tax=Leptolyngbya sp. FACHB-36 TaxID=2692808 RepID=UPI001680A0E2|nr:glycosyltransferase [Leptolyngbya sp. FACHB-36]MBD2022038.1 glycosyltransferase [Leptolyngbya sp. FACHB-36]